ncbi:Rab5-interacting protein-domain-containing protein [Apodospora peruviana]|uniref:ER membrane protein complex subunit 6 n=1 Tax=Apodospora peruviana TaxID=516989 RepID=A0AAE0IR77_9PEZI|nr:Rab5-interacting protein-domain-containing protein [Apodospora peruviana]
MTEISEPRPFSASTADPWAVMAQLSTTTRQRSVEQQPDPLLRQRQRRYDTINDDNDDSELLPRPTQTHTRPLIQSYQQPKPKPKMPTTERELQTHPIVQESVVHNTRTLYNLQSLTASLFGVGAGILGLESYYGFLFYLVCSILTSLLFYVVRIAPTAIPAAAAVSPPHKGGSGAFATSRYFRSPFEFWTGGLLNGLAGFILTWTLFYGLVRA